MGPPENSFHVLLLGCTSFAPPQVFKELIITEQIFANHLTKESLRSFAAKPGDILYQPDPLDRFAAIFIDAENRISNPGLYTWLEDDYLNRSMVAFNNLRR